MISTTVKRKLIKENIAEVQHFLKMNTRKPPKVIKAPKIDVKKRKNSTGISNEFLYHCRSSIHRLCAYADIAKQTASIIGIYSTRGLLTADIDFVRCNSL